MRSQKTHKLTFMVPFTSPVEPNRFASSDITPQGYKDGVAPTQHTSSHMISHHPLTSFHTVENKDR
jgi:hypothetical protein